VFSTGAYVFKWNATNNDAWDIYVSSATKVSSQNERRLTLAAVKLETEGILMSAASRYVPGAPLNATDVVISLKGAQAAETALEKAVSLIRVVFALWLGTAFLPLLVSIPALYILSFRLHAYTNRPWLLPVVFLFEPSATTFVLWPILPELRLLLLRMRRLRKMNRRREWPRFGTSSPDRLGTSRTDEPF
jgi:hypothetical protein